MKTTAERILTIVNDPMCYPPLDSSKEIFQRELSFAQRLRSHIEYVLTDEMMDHEDPKQVNIY